MGKHGFNPAEHIEEVEDLAYKGLTNDEIAICLGISIRSLYNYKRLNLQFSHAIKKGQAKNHKDLSEIIIDAATKKKNIIATMFLLKTRHNYRESGPIKSEEIETATPGNITFQEIDGRVKK